MNKWIRFAILFAFMLSIGIMYEAYFTGLGGTNQLFLTVGLGFVLFFIIMKRRQRMVPIR